MSEGRWPVGWPELVAPFPYFGGKRRAAPIIWRELGDPAGYVEPFAGSAGRPPRPTGIQGSPRRQEAGAPLGSRQCGDRGGHVGGGPVVLGGHQGGRGDGSALLPGSLEVM